MKQTLAARLIAKFEKLNTLYQGDSNEPMTPNWLTIVLNFLEDNRHDMNMDMKRMSELWHHMHDSASYGNWADQMRKANDEYKKMLTINA